MCANLKLNVAVLEVMDEDLEARDTSHACVTAHARAHSTRTLMLPVTSALPPLTAQSHVEHHLPDQKLARLSLNPDTAMLTPDAVECAAAAPEKAKGDEGGGGGGGGGGATRLVCVTRHL